MSAAAAPRLRSAYRRILRELPLRPTSSKLSDPSPLQRHIRTSISAPPSSTHRPLEAHIEELEQYIVYARAQRMYLTLVERYNPGMDMTEEERVRLTARRVGMEIPPELRGEHKG